jgi:arylsulfatase A-like enzyme
MWFRVNLWRGTKDPLRMLAALVLMIGTAVSSSLSGVAGERPNFILIVADDLGWADLGCYGQTFFETPHLDRLADEGVRFTSGYAASPVCSPTRSSIMTGKYPARNNLTIWLGGSGGAPAVGHLSLDEVTIAEALKEGGYATAHIGKWHLGGEPYFPERQGFDLNIGGNHTGTPAGGYFAPHRNPQLPDGPDGEYLTDRLTDECLAVIERWRDRPFFIHMAYYTPHTPIQGRKDLVEYYRRKIQPGQTYNIEYAAMIHGLDENVGRILAKLESCRLDQRTVVAFFSDNGGFSHSGGRKNNVTTNEPLRLGKGYGYEGGVRVPAIVRFPPLTGSGGRCDVPIISTDFYPTFLVLADLPPRPEQHADGVSIVPLLADPRRGTIDRDTLYWHYPHTSPQGGTPSGAIRQGDWKLLKFFCDDRLELYHLADDLGEANELSSKMPDKAETLHAKLAAWHQEVDAQMPPAVEPARRVSKTTDSFPGFATLIDVRLEKRGTGFELAAVETGIALKAPPDAITGPVTFRTTITPLQTHPANGQFVFGDGDNESELVKCGFFVGGRYAAIYEGSYPSSDLARTELVTQSGIPQEVTVDVDLPSGTVRMTVGGKSITKKLTRPIRQITHYGYGVVRTRSAFTPVVIEP